VKRVTESTLKKVSEVKGARRDLIRKFYLIAVSDTEKGFKFLDSKKNSWNGSTIRACKIILSMLMEEEI